MAKQTGPYTIRLGKLKAQLEKKAVEKDLKLPELIKGVLKNYIRKYPIKEVHGKD